MYRPMQESNLRPFAPEANALSPELIGQLWYYNLFWAACQDFSNKTIVSIFAVRANISTHWIFATVYPPSIKAGRFAARLVGLHDI